MGESDSDQGFLKRFAKWILSPFVSKSKEEVDRYKVLNKNTERNMADGSEEKGSTIFNIRPDNFLLGSAWGLISGYSSGLYSLPVPDKFRALRFIGYWKRFRFLKFMKTYDILYPTFYAFRAFRRTTLAGIVFDQAEQKSAKNLGLGHSTSSNLIGLAILSVFFRISTDIRHNVIASSTVLGGYAIGSAIAKFVHSSKNPSGKSDD